MSFVNRRYTKEVPFLSKMACKRKGGGGGGKVGGPSSYNTLLSVPLAHWAIITPRSEKLCVLLLLVIVTFYAFCLFTYSIGMLPFSLRLYELINYHVTRHMSALDQLKTFLYDKPRLKFFPCTLVESVQFRAEFANF